MDRRMAIKFPCQECGKKIGVADHLAGRRGKCPQCGTIFTVPPTGAALPPPPRVVRQDPTDYDVQLDLTAQRPSPGLPPPPTPQAESMPARRSRPAGADRALRRNTPSGVATACVLGVLVLIALVTLVKARGSDPASQRAPSASRSMNDHGASPLRIIAFMIRTDEGDGIALLNEGEVAVRVNSVTLNDEFALSGDVRTFSLKPMRSFSALYSDPNLPPPSLNSEGMQNVAYHWGAVGISLSSYRNSTGVEFGPLNFRGIKRIQVETDEGIWIGALSAVPSPSPSAAGATVEELAKRNEKRKKEMEEGARAVEQAQAQAKEYDEREARKRERQEAELQEAKQRSAREDAERKKADREKEAAALLETAKMYETNKSDPFLAVERYEDLIKQYGDTSVAKEAAERLQVLKAEGERDAAKRLARGKSLEAGGKVDSAIKEYEEVIRMYPDSKAAKDATERVRKLKTGK